MSFSGWMTLKNETNVDYINSKLTLFAGDPNIIQRRRQRNANAYMAMESVSMSAKRQAVQMPEQETLSDYFLYEFPQRVDIEDRQEKQLALLSSQSVVVSKDYFHKGALGREYRNRQSPKTKALVRYTFRNSKEEGLGRPIPKGIIRFYQSDKENERHFIGAGKLGNIAEGETVETFTGEAFGVTLKKKVSGKTRNPKNARNTWNVTYSILNSTDAEIGLVLEEFGSDRYLVTNTVENDGKKISVGRYQWKIKIPAGTTKELRYAIEELKKQ